MRGEESRERALTYPHLVYAVVSGFCDVGVRTLQGIALG
jgi:hypothetical protein